MGSYINVGAYVNGTRPKSKKALKDALKAAPATVAFDGTAAFPGMPGYGERYRGDAIPTGVILSVCGPDPYRARGWFGNVSVKADGSVKAE